MISGLNSTFSKCGMCWVFTQQVTFHLLRYVHTYFSVLLPFLALSMISTLVNLVARKVCVELFSVRVIVKFVVLAECKVYCEANLSTQFQNAVLLCYYTAVKQPIFYLVLSGIIISGLYLN